MTDAILDLSDLDAVSGGWSIFLRNLPAKSTGGGKVEGENDEKQKFQQIMQQLTW
jgi:hypothetical protein